MSQSDTERCRYSDDDAGDGDPSGSRANSTLLDTMQNMPEEDTASECLPSYHDVQASPGQSNTGPSLSILFQIIVTREDIEQVLSVASELKRSGHRIRVATFKESQDLVEGRSLEFFDIGGDAAELICHTIKNATLSLSIDSKEPQRRRALQQMLELCWQACFRPSPCQSPGSETTKHRLCSEQPFVADVIVANPYALAHIHCAERLGVPLHIIPMSPLTPTGVAGGGNALSRHLSNAVFDTLFFTRFHSIVNKFRQQTLKLEPNDPTAELGTLTQLRTSTTPCWSSNFIPTPRDYILASLPLKATKCSLDPSRVAVWRLLQHGRECHLSALAAATLIEKKLVRLDRLIRIRTHEFKSSIGPPDPITGGTLAVSQLLYNGLKGCQEIVFGFAYGTPQMDQLRKSERSSLSKDASDICNCGGIQHQSQPNKTIGSQLLKGSGRIVRASLRAPMTFSLALAQGSHNAPRLWSDRTVREQDNITGISSGVVAGCKGLVLGTYDGIAGLIAQPYIGARDDGVVGAVLGVAKGLAGVPVKFFAAMSAPVGYPLKGLDVAFSAAVAVKHIDEVATARVVQGNWEHMEATKVEREHIVQRWFSWQQGARFV